MTVTKQVATHLREAFFGENWTSSDITKHLAGLTWQQAVAKANNLHSIAMLVYHIHYFVCAALKVLQYLPLDSHDKYSFDCVAIQSQADWEALQHNMYSDAEFLASLVEQMPESQLWDDFADKKYGSYYKNLHGIIEHTYYHLGQIVLIKKTILNDLKVVGEIREYNNPAQGGNLVKPV